MKTLTEFINESIIAEANAAIEKALSKDFAGQVFMDPAIDKAFENEKYELILLPNIDELKVADVYAEGSNWMLLRCGEQSDIDELSKDHPELNNIIPYSDPGKGVKISVAKEAWEKLSEDLKNKLIGLLKK